MNRNVYAILISVPQSTEYQTKVIPGADEAMGRFRTMLEERFTHPPPVIKEFPRSDAIQQKICEAFDQAPNHVSDGDLFIVLFIGHGRKASDSHAYQAWALEDSEFTDVQLAGYLAALSKDVEVAIISDSCYGAGIATPGPTALRSVLRPVHAVFAKVRDLFYRLPFMRSYHRMQLGPMAKAWSPAALRHVGTPSEDRTQPQKLVCIAAAAWWDQVDPVVMKDLIDMTIDAAKSHQTHGALADAFDMNAGPGSTFQLISRPNDRMCKKLLARRVPLFAPDEHDVPTVEKLPMPVAGEENDIPPSLTSYVFINYNKTGTSSVKFRTVDDPTRLTEIVQAGVPNGAKIERTPGTNDYTLKLAPFVIVRFMVTFDVTFCGSNTSPGLSVITWRGKDPPVPPPPKGVLTRYQNMADKDYEDQFGWLLTVGGADDEPAETSLNGDPTRPASPPNPP